MHKIAYTYGENGQFFGFEIRATKMVEGGGQTFSKFLDFFPVILVHIRDELVN